MKFWELLHQLGPIRRDDPAWGTLLRRFETLIRRSLAAQIQGRAPDSPAGLDLLARALLVRVLAEGDRGDRLRHLPAERLDRALRELAENFLRTWARSGTRRVGLDWPLPVEDLWLLNAVLPKAIRETAEHRAKLREMDEIAERAMCRASFEANDHLQNEAIFREYFVEARSVADIVRMRVGGRLTPFDVSWRIERIRKALRTEFRRSWYGSPPDEDPRRSPITGRLRRRKRRKWPVPSRPKRSRRRR